MPPEILAETAATPTPEAEAAAADGQTGTEAAKPEAAAKTGADDGAKADDKAEAAKDANADADTEAGTKEGEGEADADLPEYEFTMPEGFDDLDADAMAAATPLLREHKVSQETAQKLVNIVAETVQRQVVRVQQELADRREKQATDWLAEMQADKGFGGAAFDRNAAAVRGVIERFGDTDPAVVYPEGHPNAGKPIPGGAVKKLLSEAGIGNAPAIIRMLHRAALATGEDSIAPGDGVGSPTAMSEADFMAEVFAKSSKT
jgi:hypothetical protein